MGGKPPGGIEWFRAGLNKAGHVQDASPEWKHVGGEDDKCSQSAGRFPGECVCNVEN